MQNSKRKENKVVTLIFVTVKRKRKLIKNIQDK